MLISAPRGVLCAVAAQSAATPVIAMRRNSAAHRHCRGIVQLPVELAAIFSAR
jgi:hypothetical protein